MSRASTVHVERSTRTECVNVRRRLVVHNDPVDKYYIKQDVYWIDKPGVVYNSSDRTVKQIILPNQKHFPILFDNVLPNSVILSNSENTHSSPLAYNTYYTQQFNSAGYVEWVLP